MAVADVNGDGLLDIITGKRWYAHPSTNPDPGTNDPALLEWFELRRAGGTATFLQHTIHTASGVKRRKNGGTSERPPLPPRARPRVATGC